MLGDPTPVEVWGPAFSWLALERVTVEEVCWSRFDAGRVFCKLCEQPVSFSARDRHVADHKRELRAFRARGRVMVKRENARRLRQLSRLRAETRRAG